MHTHKIDFDRFINDKLSTGWSKKSPRNICPAQVKRIERANLHSCSFGR